MRTFFLVLLTAFLIVIGKSDEEDCPIICPDTYDPQCGSDNVTYQNKCYALIEKCEKNKNFTWTSGECQRNE